jgi:hypothetical protein
MVSGESPSNENLILNTHHPISTPTSPIEIPLIAFNISAQINEKLTPSTFPQWRAQFEVLLIGYDLLDYVTGDHPCPSPTNTSASPFQKSHWVRQDKLILSAILASTTPTITPFISTAKTSKEAWQKLHTMYASKSRTRALQLKEELTLIKWEHKTVQEYLHTVKTLADEIALIDHPISADDLTLYILNGLGPDFREIAAPIRAREKSLMFEELYGLLVSHEVYLRRLETATQHLVATANFSNRSSGYRQGMAPSHNYSGSRGFNKYNGNRTPNVPQNRKPLSNGWKSTGQRRYQPKCQLCDQLGHVAKQCSKFHFSEPTANCVSTTH